MFENLYYNKPISETSRKLISEPVNIDLIKKNKYANGANYVPETVYRRILNKVAGHEWSFVPHSIEKITEEKKPYIRYVGMLIVPGFGIHTGIGTQTLEKKDNQNATAAAKTYAFKNACKEMGIAPNIGDETFDDELFENIDDMEIDLTEEKPKKKKKKAAPKKESSKKPATKKVVKKSAKKKPPTTDERIAEIRDAYELDNDDDFIAFIQIWDDDILELEDLDDDDWEDFLDYVEDNKDEFEDF